MSDQFCTVEITATNKTHPDSIQNNKAFWGSFQVLTVEK